MSGEETPTDDSSLEKEAKKKVVSFPKKSKRAPVPPPEVEPEPQPTANPEVVEYLTTLVERAKRGEIQAFGFAAVTHEHVVLHSMLVSGEYQNSLVAAVAYLSHTLISQNMHVDDDDTSEAS